MDTLVAMGMGILALIMLGAMIVEGCSVLFSCMKTEDQAIWEYDHFTDRGYESRRKQLLIRAGISAILAAASMALAVVCWQQFAEIKDTYDFTQKRDRPGEFLFGGGFLALAALSFVLYIGIIRAKLRALRVLRDKDAAKTKEQGKQ